MIHSDTLKELTEDELGLLWSILHHFYSKVGMECKYRWLQMVRVEVLEHVLNHCNLKEEYSGVRDSLLVKLKGGVY